ncbi:MAG: VWA domain-containing protein [Rhodospirillaceae bacterium]|nr:VWA domain-containing protein [Rhodospirillaceae bacterium]
MTNGVHELTELMRIASSRLRRIPAILATAIVCLLSPLELVSQARNETYQTMSEVPREFINESWDQGWHISSVTGTTTGYWTVFMSSRTGFEYQAYDYESTFPRDFVREEWGKDNYITEVAYADGSWFVVVSGGTQFSSQRWGQSHASPSETMSEFRTDGYHISDLEYGNGLWTIVGSKIPSFSDQVYHVSAEFPDEFIREKWDNDYSISELSYGDGNWAVVMTKLASDPRQGWRTRGSFPTDTIQSDRDNGLDVLDMVYGGGTYALVVTESLGEVMGFPPPSGGVLESRILTSSSQSATFTVDIFVVGSDSQLLSLGLEDFSIGSSESHETSFEFSATNLITYQQNELGPYSAMFLLDQSGSILSNDPTDARIDAAKVFMRNLAPTEEVGLMAFASNGQLTYSPVTSYLDASDNGNFTTDPHGFDGSLNFLATAEGGGTPLYDATRAAVLGTVNHARNANRVVIVFSDGEDTSSTASLDDAISYATQRSVPLHTIALSTDADIGVLSKMAGQTGGSLAFASDARRLISYYGALGPYLSGSGQFYRTTWRLMLQGGSFTLGRGAWLTRHVRINIPGSDIFLPFRLDF